MAPKDFDRQAKQTPRQNPAGEVELTSDDLGMVAGGTGEEPTYRCTDAAETLCPCASTIPESTCSIK